MRYQLLFLFIVLFFFEHICFAQGTIRGTLRGRSDNQPIGVGKLTLINKERRRAPKREITPNDNGTFIFTGVEEGVYDLLYEAEGYVGQRVLGLYVKNKSEKLAYLKIRPNTSNSPVPEELITTYASLQAEKQKEIKTASFDADRLIDAPATVLLLTQQDIREQGLSSISDIFNLLPSLEVQEMSSYYSANLFTIRGVQGGKKFIILLDGVRISSFTANYALMDKNIFIGNAEQVEILLGSASVMYGADAVTGVINIITKKAESNTIQLRQSAGRFDTQEYDMLATFKTKKWGIVLNGNYYKSNEANLAKFYPNDYSWFNQRYSQTGEMPLGGDTSQTMVLPVNPFTVFRQSYWLNFLMSNNNWEIGGQFNSQKHSSSVASYDIFSTHSKKSFFKDNSLNLFVRHNFTPKTNKWQIQSLLNFNAHENDPKTNFGDGYNNFKISYQYGFNYTTQLNEIFTYKIDSNSQIQAGLNANYTYALPSQSNPFANQLNRWNIRQQIETQEYVGSRVLWQDSIERFVPRVAQLTNQFNIGLFSQYKATFFKKVFLTIGARIDVFGQGNQQRKIPFTPRCGIVYKPNNNITAKLFYGEAFLVPSLDISFSNYIVVNPILDSNNLATGYTIPYAALSAALKPERMRTIETNLSYNKNNFYASLNAYYNNSIDAAVLITNNNVTSLAIDTAILPVEYAEKYTNAGSLQSYGGFVQIEYNLQAGEKNQFGLKLHTDYSFTSGRINKTSDNATVQLALPYAAQHTIRAGFTLRYQSFSLNLRGIYRGLGYNAGIVDETTGEFVQNVTPGFFAVNLFANYRINSKKDVWYTDLFVRINNLTNTRYYHTGFNLVDIMQQIPQAPLRWAVGALFYITP